MHCSATECLRLNKRLHGFAVRLMDFDIEIRCQPGKENTNTDGMSRQALEVEDTNPAPSPSAQSTGFRLEGEMWGRV